MNASAPTSSCRATSPSTRSSCGEVLARLRRLVLNENFEDAKAQFLAPLMAINYAHLVMLAEQEIVRRADAGAHSPGARRHRPGRRPRDRSTTAPTRISSSTSSGSSRGGCGDDAAGRLHTARSRNDIDMTMYRMQQRQWILALIDGDAGAARRADPAGRALPRRRVSRRTRTRSRRSPRRSRITCRR